MLGLELGNPMASLTNSAALLARSTYVNVFVATRVSYTVVVHLHSIAEVQSNFLYQSGLADSIIFISGCVPRKKL